MALASATLGDMTRSYSKTRPSRSPIGTAGPRGQGIGTTKVVIEYGATVATKL